MSSVAVFKIKGSAVDPYVVTVTKEGAEVQATCTCPAGAIGQACKHRIGLLTGKPEGVIEGDPKLLAGWLDGSKLHAAMQELADLEAQAEMVKKRISAAKKQLGRLMG